MEGVSPRRTSAHAIVCICIDIDICKLAEPNHRAYASRHGYDYLYLSKAVPEVPTKMLKYLALAWGMERGYEWLLKMDADTIVTNCTKTIPSLVREVEPSDGISLIATRGGNWKNVHALNNGIFLLKNTEWAMKHCFEIFTAKYAYTRFLCRTLVDQPVQLSLLVAQKELKWPPRSEVKSGNHVMIVPKRHFNSFKRDDYYATTDQDEGGQWQHDVGTKPVHFHDYVLNLIDIWMQRSALQQTTDAVCHLSWLQEGVGCPGPCTSGTCPFGLSSLAAPRFTCLTLP